LFSKRLIEPELLDHLPPDEARPNLADLVRINAKFGGHSVLRRAVLQATKGDSGGTFLDVGAASGDSARQIQQCCPGATITCIDYNATNFENAPPPKALANVFDLPFKPASFDYVFCSLFLHHFSDGAVKDILRNLYGVARKAIIICDLERHPLPYIFLPLTRPFFKWNRITVHDGIRSVRAAFRAGELEQLAKGAGITNVEIRRYRPAFRITLVGRKEEPVGTRRKYPPGACSPKTDACLGDKLIIGKNLNERRLQETALVLGDACTY
jgi:ubiquinone/menaquinone biosynthesis C-methylase UbiE